MIILLTALAAGLAAPETGQATSAPCYQAALSDAALCRAENAQRAGDPAAAATAFEEAAKAAAVHDPRVGRMWAAAGNMWIEANQPGKAAFALDQALASPGMSTQQRGETLLDRARAAEVQGDLKTARAKLTEAADSIADDPFYWYFSAALAIREGDAATAKSAIDKALALAPSDATVLFEAGHVADFTGDEDQARRYWTKAAAGDPNGEVGKAAAKAIELLGVTPVVKSGAQPPK